MKAWKTVFVLVLPALACGGGMSIGAGGTSGGIGIGGAMGESKTKYSRDIDEWHKGRIQRLKADDGWLTLVGLFPMTNGTHTFGSAADNEFVFPAGAPAHAGSITMADTVFTLTPASGSVMTLAASSTGEKPVPFVAGAKVASDAHGHPTKIQMGSIQFYVIDRSPNTFLRVKDANSPVRKNFKSIERYTVDKKWRFDATFEKYNPPHPIKVPNILGYEDDAMCPGRVTFEMGGKTYHLEPIAQEGDELSFVFGDATSGHETYGGGRELYCPMPGPDGKTVLDFNKAYNPPCVFTQFATCPLPTRENVLPFKVEAGEKAYGDPALHMHD